MARVPAARALAAWSSDFSACSTQQQRGVHALSHSPSHDIQFRRRGVAAQFPTGRVGGGPAVHVRTVEHLDRRGLGSVFFLLEGGAGRACLAARGGVPFRIAVLPTVR